MLTTFQPKKRGGRVCDTFPNLPTPSTIKHAASVLPWQPVHPSSTAFVTWLSLFLYLSVSPTERPPEPRIHDIIVPSPLAQQVINNCFDLTESRAWGAGQREVHFGVSFLSFTWNLSFHTDTPGKEKGVKRGGCAPRHNFQAEPAGPFVFDNLRGQSCVITQTSIHASSALHVQTRSQETLEGNLSAYVRTQGKNLR